MNNRKQNNAFNFFVPASFEKGKKNGKDVIRVKGIASTSSSKDSDGETLFPEGFDYSSLLERGYLNWDHQQKSRATAIVGEPDVAKIINGGKDFYIEGFLYPDSEEAQQIYSLAQVLEKNSTTRRLGYSIEGQVIERGSTDKSDPRYKQVLKARITGVAITPCPKNPNTLLSLVKGEYNDLYQDDDQNEICPKCGKEIVDGKCECAKKAFSAEGSEDLRPESVEGVKYDLKENKLTVGGSVRKSEIYNLIAQNYTTDIEKAKKIYSLIETVNSKMFNMQSNEISQEAVDQAFEFLNKAAGEGDISKALPGREAEARGNGSEADKDVTKSADAKDKDKEVTDQAGNIVKGDSIDIEKAKEMCKGLLESGLSKGEAIDSLVKSGATLEIATGAVESVVAAMSGLKENGGTITQVSPGTNDGVQALSKADAADLLKDLLKDVMTEPTELIKSMSGTMDKKFHSVGVLSKKILEQNETLRGTVDELQKSNTAMAERLEKIENTRIPAKSIVSANQVERFAKSEGGENGLPAGATVYELRNPEDRSAIADFFDAQIVKSRSNGVAPSKMLEEAVAEIEMCKSLPAAAISFLRANNIFVRK